MEIRAQNGKMPGKSTDYLEERLVGSSASIDTVRNFICQVAPTNSTVLLLGESGTGKEVIARGIHECSTRCAGPFIPVNCGAIPSELLESELFGHEKGAFTGAFNSRKGRFELAEGGTLFLDEIGDMPLEMQVKLLRVLQERTFERVGATKMQRCDVRIIAATHQQLEQKVEDGSFRIDLFYRLNVFPIDVPPLRERTEDIPALAARFIQQFEEEQRDSVRLMPDTLEHLCDYNWPGNIRELANLVERLTILYPSRDVYAIDLPKKYCSSDLPLTQKPDGITADIGLDGPFSSSTMADLSVMPVAFGSDSEVETSAEESREDLSSLYAGSPVSVTLLTPLCLDFEEPLDLKAHLIDVEKALILSALEKTGWVNTQAAKLLCLQRTTLVEKMRKYKIQRDDNGEGTS